MSSFQRATTSDQLTVSGEVSSLALNGRKKNNSRMCRKRYSLQTEFTTYINERVSILAETSLLYQRYNSNVRTVTIQESKSQMTKSRVTNSTFTMYSLLFLLSCFCSLCRAALRWNLDTALPSPPPHPSHTGSRCSFGDTRRSGTNRTQLRDASCRF